MFDLHDVVLQAPLGDQRRNKRAIEIVTELIQGGGHNAADGVHAPGEAGTWAHAMGALRFYNNEELTLPALYEPCRNALAHLVPRGRRAYAVYDFSTVDYSHHDAKEDRVQVGNEYGLGYELFSVLLLDDQGHPLGPVVQEIRTVDGCLSSESTRPLPFVDHLSQAERAIEATSFHLPEREIVAVMDREFDDIALQRWLGLGADAKPYVIRASQMDRQILLWGRETSLRNAVHAAPRHLAGKIKREGKTYELWVAETFVTLHRRSLRGRKRGQSPRAGEPLPVRVVIADLRRGKRRTHQWVLLTNLKDPIEQVVQIYTWRWRVERLFFFAKVGMKLETWGQQNGQRIARRLALSSLAAMAVYQLKVNQDDPVLMEATREVATLGGWLGRKTSSIGPIVLMRGMMSLISAMAMIERYGFDKLLELATTISQRVGLPFPLVGPSLRAPRRSARPSSDL